MALCSLSLIKQFLGLSLTEASQDAQLMILKDAAERAVKSYCGRDFEVTTYTEYHSGTNTRELVLKHRPVLTVTSVHLDWNGNSGQNPDGSYPASSLLVQGKDYSIDLDGTWNSQAVSFSGILYRIRNVWPEIQRQWYPLALTPENYPVPGLIRVIYSAGYDPIPEDLQYATAYLVSYMKRTVVTGAPLKIEKIGDYSYELALLPMRGTAPELTTARQILSRYREIAL